MAAHTRETTTNAVEMLKSDHKKVKKLFREYAELGDNAHKSKERLAEEIFQELEVHSKLEEEIFYPAAEAAADKEVGEVVAEGLEEHHVVDILMAEIRALSPEDEAFDAKMKVLCENVEHHIEEEETELLPEAQQALGDEVERLGMEMKQRKQQLLTAMR